MLQAAVGNGLSFDPFSFCQNIRRPPEVDVGGGLLALWHRTLGWPGRGSGEPGDICNGGKFARSLALTCTRQPFLLR